MKKNCDYCEEDEDHICDLCHQVYICEECYSIKQMNEDDCFDIVYTCKECLNK